MFQEANFSFQAMNSVMNCPNSEPAFKSSGATTIALPRDDLSIDDMHHLRYLKKSKKRLAKLNSLLTFQAGILVTGGVFDFD